jgi:hypothetical protein
MALMSAYLVTTKNAAAFFKEGLIYPVRMMHD